MLLFFPWTNDVTQATDTVPYIGQLRQPDVQSWRHALRARLVLHGFPTQEVKRWAQNFCFVYCQAREHSLVHGLMEHTDNELEDDEPLVMTEAERIAVRSTHIRSGRGQGQEADMTEEGDSAKPQLPDDEAEEQGQSQHERTQQMFRISRDVWRHAEGPAARDEEATRHYEMFKAKEPIADDDKVLRAAKESKAKEGKEQRAPLGEPAPGQPSVAVSGRITAAELRDWLHGDCVQGRTNKEQFEFLELLVDRVLVELGLAKPDKTRRKSEDPLIWLLHGPPGTGKSHVLQFVRQLFGKLDYAEGIDFEFTAFQAVNAVAIGGKTLPHALGLNVAQATDQPIKKETAKRISFWRWLIIDEIISLVHARLLAQVDQRLRMVIPAANKFKRDPAGQPRPFAGLNVLLTGDFQQLPPPTGGYLATVPRCLSGRGGRELLWNGAVQGVTELSQRERCKDAWWNEVVDQLRQGQLSEENWKYLHGKPVDGCQLSREERESRCRLPHSSYDRRLREGRFKYAVAIVANNDARCQINKDRAEGYAEESGSTLRWAVAKDKASSAALQAKPCDKQTKMQWLQYPDRSTGDLCGTLPLAIGMPVALTDHWDRSPDKNLLRGSRGHVHSWRWAENEDRPSIGSWREPRSRASIRSSP